MCDDKAPIGNPDCISKTGWWFPTDTISVGIKQPFNFIKHHRIEAQLKVNFSKNIGLFQLLNLDL